MHDFEDFEDHAFGGGDFDVAAVFGEFVVDADELADAVAGDVVEVGAVDDDFFYAGVDEGFELADEFGGGFFIEAAVGARMRTFLSISWKKNSMGGIIP